MAMDTQLNKIAYITGTSRGLGKALAELLLEKGYFVFGVSRNETRIDHSNFESVNLDLSDHKAVEKFRFYPKNDAEVLLINNAGVIGEIAPVGTEIVERFQKVHQVNTIAPQVLTHLFYQAYSATAKNGHVLNISSGAGKRSIDAWAAYCSSKAALDLFAETFRAELESRAVHNWDVHSVAPGVADTSMQQEIRDTAPENFLELEKFIALHQNRELKSAQEVAGLIYQIISDPKRFASCLQSVRDLDQ